MFIYFSVLWAEPFADVHKVKGLQGIYIVSQLSSTLTGGSVDVGLEHIVTLITFDWGVDWRLLNVTRSFSYCEKVICINLLIDFLLTNFLLYYRLITVLYILLKCLLMYILSLEHIHSFYHQSLLLELSWLLE